MYVILSGGLRPNAPFRKNSQINKDIKYVYFY